MLLNIQIYTLLSLYVHYAMCSSLDQHVTEIEPSTQSPNDAQSIGDQQFFESSRSPNQRCDDARLKCAFRLDCGQALTSYMIHCADLIAGTVNIDNCPSKCFKALIALASTEHGVKLVNCDCGDSQFCKLSKERIQVCKAKVEHQVAHDTVVSCSTAKFICQSNTQCLTALTYYNKFCKAMFKGKYCSKHCLNSMNILQRQKYAHKLRTCFCDGSEDFPCEAIKQNTESLCLKKTNYSSDTSIELLSNKKDHRPFDQSSKNHHNNHHHKSHHHKNSHANFDYEQVHRSTHHSSSSVRQQTQFASSAIDFADATNRFDTSPIDSDQIKNFKYFDVMISEALSSRSHRTRSSYLIFISILILSFCFFSNVRHL